MRQVAVELDAEQEGPVVGALREAGFSTGGGGPWARAVVAREGTFEDAAPYVEWVLRGGVLAICGGTGPLLAALALTPGEQPIEGQVEPAAPRAPPLPLLSAWPVTGVGYALYRIGDRTVALAGRRGDGWVICVGSAEPLLVAACLSWVAS